MTVQNTIVKNRYVGNHATTVFPITFDMDPNHPEYIHVYVNTNDGDEETDNFEIDKYNRSVIYPKVGAPLAEGSTIVIKRTLPLHQLLNLVNQGPYFAEDIEQNFDDLTCMIQQLNETMDRTLTLGITVDEKIVDTTLPYGKDKTFKWNSEGTGFELTEDPAKVLIIATEKIEAFEKQALENQIAQEQKVDQQINEIKTLVGKQIEDLQLLYNELSGATKEDLMKIAELCKQYANVAENAAWVNSRWPISKLKDRVGNTFGLENADVTTLPLASKNVKIQVISDSDTNVNGIPDSEEVMTDG